MIRMICAWTGILFPENWCKPLKYSFIFVKQTNIYEEIPCLQANTLLGVSRWRKLRILLSGQREQICPAGRIVKGLRGCTAEQKLWWIPTVKTVVRGVGAHPRMTREDRQDWSTVNRGWFVGHRNTKNRNTKSLSRRKYWN